MNDDIGTAAHPDDHDIGDVTAIADRMVTVRTAVEYGAIRWADAYLESAMTHPQRIEPGMLTPAGPAPYRNRKARRDDARRSRRRR